MAEQHDNEIRRRSIWFGTVSFGLVSIPVALLPARRSQQVRLRMLGPDGTPLARKYYCPVSNRLIEQEEIIRGYEVEEGKFITVTDDELESLQPQKSREIDLRRFVPAEQIDPKYLDRPYFLAPLGDSRKAYRLLTEIMEKSDKVGIATFVMRSREYLVAILAENGLLIAETLRFADEIRSPEAIGGIIAKEIPKELVERMAEEIRSASADELDLDELKDISTAKLVALAERKRLAGRDVVVSPERDRERETESEEHGQEPGKIIDLMQFLKRSVEMESAQESTSEAQDRDPLEKLSKPDLYGRAKKLEIPGRSSMDHRELLEAVRESQRTS
ncbi:Ku protein [Desulfonatronum lacustre]|uniref:non-homologous end joining protein Ku n=1 Tax=Desulfonatronum lacustre TaxID=66849 RepID=UPI00048CE74B|nr:Ku protein [Desulfonatronum lacustre]